MPQDRREYFRQYNAKRKEAEKERNAERQQKLKTNPVLLEKRRHEQRETQARRRERARRNPLERQKINARARVGNRVRRFKTWPRPEFFLCSDCDAKAMEYHHEDYELWWSVEPLCKTCHVKRHDIV